MEKIITKMGALHIIYENDLFWTIKNGVVMLSTDDKLQKVHSSLQNDSNWKIILISVATRYDNIKIFKFSLNFPFSLIIYYCLKLSMSSYRVTTPLSVTCMLAWVISKVDGNVQVTESGVATLYDDTDIFIREYTINKREK